MLTIGRAETQRHAVLAQRIDFRQTKLQRVIPEHVGHGGVKLLLLPAEHITPAGEQRNSDSFTIEPLEFICSLP